MPTSQKEISLQMLSQLRLLDPSASAEVGTPERQILDTVAAALADNQIDLTLLQGSIDFNSKFGESLDRFFGLFRFNRQAATFAEGYVTFGRLVPANQDIRIPLGTQVLAPSLTGDGDTLDSAAVVFATTFDSFLPTGELEVTVPVRATTSGSTGNVAAQRVTTFTGSPLVGITTVTNNQAMSGGRGQETDDEFKTRFKNTVFRNLAGTQDQFLATALSLAFSTKSNVVGPVSRYREYIQVPALPDNSGGNGAAGEYTTALSTNPYAQYVWNDIPFFISNGDSGINAVFYRPETDFRMNLLGSDKNKGDAYRLFGLGTGDDPRDPAQLYRSNITFTNVYTGTDPDVQAIRPEDVVLLEFSYMSNVSRNDYDHKILNCVDVFVDGENPVTANTVIPRPTSAHLLVDNVDSKFHYDNFRYYGAEEHRPIIGSALTPLFWEPVVDIPDQIQVLNDVTTYTFYRDIHYRLVEDVSEHAGTVRARNGIAWNNGIPSQLSGDDEEGPYTGPYVTELSGDLPIFIEGYKYDRNIIDLQTALEAAKQVTTDVLGHRARRRYFRLDVSVMYTQGSSISGTNQAIHDAVESFFDGQYFGSVIQLSDLLQVIHSVGGVDNVRWSSDVPNGLDTDRLVRTDSEGNPLLGIQIDRRQQGHSAGAHIQPEVQQIVITGKPTGGTFKLGYGLNVSAAFNHNVVATGAAPGGLQTELRTITGDASLTVTGTGTYANPFIVTFSTNAAKSMLTVNENLLTGGDTIYDSDFILQDDELPALPSVAQPGDSEPGLIIRPRAQQTWVKR